MLRTKTEAAENLEKYLKVLKLKVEVISAKVEAPKSVGRLKALALVYIFDAVILADISAENCRWRLYGRPESFVKTVGGGLLTTEAKTHTAWRLKALRWKETFPVDMDWKREGKAG